MTTVWSTFKTCGNVIPCPVCISGSAKGKNGKDKHDTGGLDVEFAKSLRDFFKEVKDVQTGIKDMTDYGKYPLVNFHLSKGHI